MHIPRLAGDKEIISKWKVSYYLPQTKTNPSLVTPSYATLKCKNKDSYSTSQEQHWTVKMSAIHLGGSLIDQAPH